MDFDETLADFSGRPIIPLGSLSTFLAEEPFVVQTWNPEGAITFFRERFTELPQPLLIIDPPSFRGPANTVVVNGEPEEWASVGKDFSALGITGATIFDDWPPELIRAPGCTIKKL